MHAGIRVMSKYFFIIFLLLILVGCSNREKAVPAPSYGYRYFINKVVRIDGSTVDLQTIPESCADQYYKRYELISLDIPESEWHKYMKMNKWCTSLFNGQPDTTIYSLRNPPDTELCDSDGNCIVKPDIYLKDNNVFQVSFCNSKYYTQMRYDSLNISKDFESARSTWGTSYEISVADSLIVLNGLNKEVKMFFYVEKKEWCKDCPLEMDVSRYVLGPFSYTNSSVCSQKKDISF